MELKSGLLICFRMHYKSEVGSIIESASFIQEYEISIQTYKNAIEQILGIKFVNGFLYSTDIGDFFEIKKIKKNVN